MKWLLLILIAVNVVLFVFQYKSDPNSSAKDEFSKSDSASELKLLSESSGGTKEKCIVISDEAVGTVVKDFVGGLKAQNVSVEEVVNVKEMAPSFWVFLAEPVELKQLNKLKELKIESYLVGDGEFKGKRSVGLFANIDLARNMIKRIEAHGLVVDIAEKKRQKEVRWVSVKVKNVAEREEVAKLASQLNINTNEFKEIFCKSIASEK